MFSYSTVLNTSVIHPSDKEIMADDGWQQQKGRKRRDPGHQQDFTNEFGNLNINNSCRGRGGSNLGNRSGSPAGQRGDFGGQRGYHGGQSHNRVGSPAGQRGNSGGQRGNFGGQRGYHGGGQSHNRCGFASRGCQGTGARNGHTEAHFQAKYFKIDPQNVDTIHRYSRSIKLSDTVITSRRVKQ
jgi:hypothetical protein